MWPHFVFLERSELSRIGCWTNGLSYLKKKGGWIKMQRLFPNWTINLSFRINNAHRDNPSLVFRNPLQQETHSLLIPFQKWEEEKKRSLVKEVDCKMKINQKFLIEYASGWPRNLFERIRHFSSEKLLIFREDKTVWAMKTLFQFVFPSHI